MEQYTTIYTERRTFGKYDEGRIIGYLNEELVPDYTPQDSEETVLGYQYTGPEKDGGTIMPCKDPTSYGEVTNAIIRSKLTESDELAIQRHHQNDAEAYSQEWNDYNGICEDAKVIARRWLGLETEE